jgi:phosphoribosylformimino-5-aminoimidazole carboxamide ribotide isomerase
MLIIPVLYLKAGRCVQVCGKALNEGSVVSDDPIDTAGRWMDAGVKCLHIFDVDGAQQGRAVNKELIVDIAQRFPNLALHIEGGVRSLGDIEAYLKPALSKVVLSSKAIEDPDFVGRLCKAFPERVIVSLNLTEQGVVSNAGTELSDLSAKEWLVPYNAAGIAALIIRDSERTGTLAGVNIEDSIAIAEAALIPIWVSGGLADMDDIRALYAEAEFGIGGVMIGRALDEKRLSVVEAQQYCEE